MIAVFLCNILAFVAPVPPRLEPGVMIAPESTHVQMGDPLMVKVMLVAGYRADVVLDQSFASSTGIVSFEVAPPGEDAFRPIRIQGQGLISEFGDKKIVPRSATIATYEWLFRARKAYIFDSPGRWRVRAIARLEKDRIVSPHCEVVVTRRAEAGIQSLDSNRSALQDAIDCIGASPDIRARFPRQGIDALAGSNAGSIIIRFKATHHLSVVKNRSEYEIALKEVATVRSHLSGPAVEHFDLETAHALLIADRTVEAEKILLAVPGRSTQKDELLARLKQQHP